MTRVSIIVALLAPFSLWVGQTTAQANAGADSTHARGTSFYGDDPLAGVKYRIEQIMGVYLLDPPRRHETERVTIQGGKIYLSYWRVLGAGMTETEIKTMAVQWFMFGRNQFSSGVRGIFSEMPNIEEVTLVFQEVERPDGTTRRNGTDKVIPYLSIRLTRKRFEKLDLDRLAICTGQGDCAREFRRAFNDSRFNSRYFRRRQAEDF